MAIAIYFHPESMTTAQYDAINSKLGAAGQASPAARIHHSCFGESGSLMVFDVWNSQEDFDAFGATLMPILQEVGVDVGQPHVMPVHNLIQ